MKVIFTKACNFNGHKRVVGNITILYKDKLEEAFRLGVAKPYDGIFPPKKKTKINLKDLK